MHIKRVEMKIRFMANWFLSCSNIGKQAAAPYPLKEVYSNINPVKRGVQLTSYFLLFVRCKECLSLSLEKSRTAFFVAEKEIIHDGTNSVQFFLV